MNLKTNISILRNVWSSFISLSYLLVRLVLCFSEEANVLDEPGFDVFVIHELTEDIKLLAQELVGEVHLKEREIPPAS